MLALSLAIIALSIGAIYSTTSIRSLQRRVSSLERANDKIKEEGDDEP